MSSRNGLSPARLGADHKYVPLGASARLSGDTRSERVAPLRRSLAARRLRLTGRMHAQVSGSRLREPLPLRVVALQEGLTVFKLSWCRRGPMTLPSRGCEACDELVDGQSEGPRSRICVMYWRPTWDKVISVTKNSARL